MSWSNVGPITDVEPGHSVVWNYSWQNGQDMGLQLAGPHYPTSVVSPGNLPTLVASNQGIQLDGFGKGGGVMVNYVVTITNVSPNESGRHNLQGGGVS
jgi:hypothetical protein